MVYEQITANKRKTWFLLSLFSVVIISLGWAFGTWSGNQQFGIFLAVIISVIMTLVGYYKGDSVALATSGARQIEKQDHPELYRLVENLAITAGIPTPKVYIIEDSAMNAFATGRDPEHASVAVTTGLLHALDRQELEGVLAHELSHIGNYDIRVMTLVVVLVGVILLLSDWMTRSFFFGRGSRDNDNNSSAGIMLIVGIALAILSPIFAELIKLAVSRQREYLADASGCLLTRYPDGLVRALEKIATQDQPLARANHATAHLFLANPFDPHVTKKFEQLFSTHPPIEERIARLKKAMNE
ncbi:zinc metalloprotease HtpX [Candidatus Uhrbacteria bacterium RIFCSPHIGHO2_02_FULL_47_44]|uniref:Protease HtpX homolog n=1 Tax=Candidatus Uhrbacteria bacterium RIFCSPLOWO2_02_FULL_48_18 TaxID=1802408 RepID=A0A1F7V6R8_9BACT|nr:MAG: zinc metalloprotease HtpX [Candidatus Uhrbacteria bacterium RIFCSPHIGHO2_01_FULL_47_10]OGL69755.1 MAG: zinc metalloprotease HtpX [Candidatus Uhrbacteria bacterium RIFCSPHIGHO2_02_FULL_47_44]OGL77863.1 MAG: zinc metalloprotease HtpX [Candidatus Uhrbacteria bacterium RIFCSPHIGHO2_12_FULL_47_12]OGL80315.1 MAG: zinc metalloprotease HtpX [Candidatus Uhrbacteria bacterium RIFCSPLOWO2_01_FULL_47_17]OGL86173.1 MAG: zinc metalloprotease HtpX [Candidatus Uhrbacteria bacterium RIFCSPLOWO2_02_FULL_